MIRFALCGTICDRTELYPLREGLNRVGSDAVSDVELPFRGVSRRHARLTIRGDSAHLEDLASKNGTFVNGRRIGSDQVALEDRLRFGPVELAFRRVPAEEGDLAMSWRTEGRAGADARETTLLGHDLSRSALEDLDLPPFPAGYVTSRSAKMRQVYRLLAAIAPSLLPVLVMGETGTGKEWVARILHAWSDRSAGPFITLNCAALPSHLIEAELFGIGKGVATGVDPRQGRFVAANGGTLLLDEVGELPIDLQPKLLRALEAGVVQPLGGPTSRIDVRIVAATNVRLEERTGPRGFREDLYYRLAGSTVHLPPLRDRAEDVSDLVKAFVERARLRPGREIRGLTLGAVERLAAAPWPGNVRQLKHEVERLVLTHRRGQTIDSDKLGDLGPGTGDGSARSSSGGGATRYKEQLAELETRLLVEALRHTRGNRSEAARALGLSRNGLAMKMRRLGIDPASL